MVKIVFFYPKKGVLLYTKGRISIFKIGVSHSLKGRGPKELSGSFSPRPPSILTPPLRGGWRRRCCHYSTQGRSPSYDLGYGTLRFQCLSRCRKSRMLETMAMLADIVMKLRTHMKKRIIFKLCLFRVSPCAN